MSHTIGMPKNRRGALHSLLIGSLIAVHGGVAHSGLVESFNQLVGRSGTLHILALDLSSSVGGADPRALYPELTRTVLHRIEPGDILLLLPMGEQGQASVPIEKFDFARTGKSMEDKKNRLAQIKAANAAIDAMLLRKPSKQSRLIEDFAALKPEIAAAVARGMAVNLDVGSDMLESSKLGDMETAKFTTKTADTLLQQVQRQNLLMYTKSTTGSEATLRAVVVGAGGSTPEVYQTVEKFWREYFAASGFAVAHYGRTVPSRL